MLNSLLNTLSFGSTIQQDGKPYTVIMRLTDRMFVVMEQNAKLPTQLMLAQADIQMTQPQPGGAGPAPKVLVPPASGGPAKAKGTKENPPAQDVAPTGSNKPEKDGTVH